jgi:transcriptional regulator of acetoin/glycerol metabolism
MARSLLIIVSDDYMEVQKAKAWAQQNGLTVNSYNHSQWTNGLEDTGFRSALHTEEVNLQAGNQAVTGGKVLAFPNRFVDDKKVHTINEVEKDAIENAIMEFRGNLTEAAKALGIGRATLYRKVKQYQIDPSVARRKTTRAA